MHNVTEEDILRPAAWNAFGMDNVGADYRACANCGTQFKKQEENFMLKGIPKILSLELLKVFCKMGHSDRLVIADGNFSSESMGKTQRLYGATVTAYLNC